MACILLPTSDALSIDTKVNDIVTLTLTFVLKIAFLDFVACGGIVFHISFSRMFHIEVIIILRLKRTSGILKLDHYSVCLPVALLFVPNSI